MGHHIQTIVASASVGNAIRAQFPQLICVEAKQGFVLLPVDAHFIDSVTQPRPSQSPNEFLLLTDSFCDLLCDMSRLGTLAYIETDYTAGKGGQGAVVYSNGEVPMKPAWAKAGVINTALKVLGVRRWLLGDRFTALGLPHFRCNDDFLDAASAQNGKG